MITPGGFSSAHHVMNDETFRNSVCDIELCVGQGIGDPDDDDTDWDLTMHYIINGSFRSDFLILVEQAQHVKKVNIVSPCIPSDATIIDEINIKCAWRKVVVDAFAAMTSPKGFKLKMFELGSNEGFLTPIQLLASISKTSNVFSKLTNLSLYNIVEDDEEEKRLTTPSNTIAPTQVLADFITLAPKLVRLEHLGQGPESVRFDQIPHHLPLAPPLTEVVLCSLTVSETVLIRGLKLIFKTLNRLSGRYRTVEWHLADHLHIHAKETMSKIS
jgi:hypothetical protein